MAAIYWILGSRFRLSCQMAVVPKTGTPESTNPIYSHALFNIGLGAVVVGVIAILLIPSIKKLWGDNSKNEPRSLSAV